MEYQHIADAWNSGKAKKQIPERQYEIVARLWNQGLNETEIASKLHKSSVTIKNNLREARLRGIKLIDFDESKVWKKYDPNKARNVTRRVESKRTKNVGVSLSKQKALINYKVTLNSDTEKYLQEKTSSILESDLLLSQKIKELLKLKFPLEVAKLLDIKPKVVYDLIDGLSEEEIKSIKKNFIENRLNINNNLIALQDLGKTPNKALELIDSKLPKELIGELAEVYFILGRDTSAINILRRLWTFDYITPEMENKLQSRIIYFESEIKAKRIRKEIKKQQTEGKQVSYYNLCKKYRVNEDFLAGILGEEEKDY